ncbi:MAG: U32 family peptidase [Candidatus Paceibacterota bacterium]|jgi:putative protease
MNKTELLAPAGDYGCFLSAISAGADAVYFGGKNFSARSSATNLSDDEIAKAFDYAHLRGVKCYVTLNTIIKDAETKAVFDYINFLYEKGADALIIQDLGVLNMCKKYWPDLALHASTQMTAHSINDVLRLRKMGFKRVVLSRELTLSEIREIKDKCDIEIECFIHGALCFSYSGKCYLSSTIGPRSGNRGRCAQPCRKKYSLFDRENNRNLDEAGYLLSTKDLCALEITDKLKFIDSLKIEGRMKSAEYVANTVLKYRKYIDMAAGKNEDELKKDKEDLAAIFNRGGFCSGYYLEKKSKDLIGKDRSKNFGILVGEVIEKKRNNLITVKVENVKVNDGLEIWGRLGQEENVGFRVPKIDNGIVQARLTGDVEVGDPVYKTFDYDLNLALSKYNKEIYPEKIPVRIFFEARLGKKMILRMNDVEVLGNEPQQAVKMSTGKTAVEEQLGKLGGTVFSANSVKCVIDEDINIPFKDINNLRRAAVSALEEKLIRSHRREKKIYREYRTDEGAAENIFSRKIAVETDDMEILKNLEGKNIYRIYTSLKLDIKRFKKNGTQVFQKLPSIIRAGEKAGVFPDYDGYLVSNLGGLEVLPGEKQKIANYDLNIFNGLSIKEIRDCGFSGFTASIESTLDEINALDKDGMEKEVIVYGRYPAMISEHCVLFDTKHCRRKNIGLKDDQKAVYPIRTDCANCRMEILSEHPIELRRLQEVKADLIRIVHTIETPNRFMKKIDEYIAGKFSGKKNIWTGHFLERVQ